MTSKHQRMVPAQESQSRAQHPSEMQSLEVGSCWHVCLAHFATTDRLYGKSEQDLGGP